MQFCSRLGNLELRVSTEKFGQNRAGSSDIGRDRVISGKIGKYWAGSSDIGPLR